VPQIALTVPGTIIMVLALPHSRRSSFCGFAIGAMAMGLAAVRVFDRRQVENPAGA
jgi:hypothetical protein